jgi:sugar phosphate permease
VKRTFSFLASPSALVGSGTALIAATYGLVRLAYGLFLPDVQQAIGLGDGPAGWIASGSSVVYCIGALVGFVVAPARPRTAVVLAALTAGLGVGGMAVSPGRSRSVSPRSSARQGRGWPPPHSSGSCSGTCRPSG